MRYIYTHTYKVVAGGRRATSPIGRPSSTAESIAFQRPEIDEERTRARVCDYDVDGAELIEGWPASETDRY